MKIMILHKNDAWHGGVVNFVRMLKKPPHDTTFVSEYIGPRSADEHKTISAARPLADAVSVAFKLRHSDNDLLFVNPSLNKASFLRDGLICMVCKWIPRKPQVIFFHGWSDNFCTRIQRNRFYKFWFNHSFAKANLIFVLAKRFKSDLQRLGVDPDRIIFTPTMFDEDDIRSNKSEASEPRIRLLFMSRLVREKVYSRH
ncbi:MAG: hypothetical protein IPM37_03195 [Hahellaceae bacterium]|nr:hypothetical protein [Hahellaceae bacterium]